MNFYCNPNFDHFYCFAGNIWCGFYLTPAHCNCNLVIFGCYCMRLHYVYVVNWFVDDGCTVIVC